MWRPAFKRRQPQPQPQLDDEQNAFDFFPSEHPNSDVEMEDEREGTRALVPVGPKSLQRDERDWPPVATFPQSVIYLVIAAAIGAISVGIVSMVISPRDESRGKGARPIASALPPATAPAPRAEAVVPPAATPEASVAPAAPVTPRSADVADTSGRTRTIDAALPPPEPSATDGAIVIPPPAAAASEGEPSRPVAVPEIPPPAPTAVATLPRPEPPALTPPTTSPAMPPPTTPPAAAAAPVAAAAVIVPKLDDREAIQALLQTYRDSYTRLDSASAASIWPTVDTRALSRAFSTLTQQEVRFERCSLKLDDKDQKQASAVCIGEIEYVRRLGDQTPRKQNMSWAFDFVRRSERWEITNVDAR